MGYRAGMRPALLSLVTCTVLLASACGPGAADAGGAKVPAVTLGDGGASPGMEQVDAGHSVDMSGAAPKLCGCSLCEPLPSDDACTTDADCAPSTPCHATACVAKAKAEPRKPGTMCTQEMRCATSDANACGCVAGRCALHPYPKKD